MSKLRTILIYLLVTIHLEVVGEACPFCSAISPTFTEEMEMMDVAVFVRLKSKRRKRTTELNFQVEMDEEKFEIIEVLKGVEYFKVGDIFRTVYLGTAEKDDCLLVMASGVPKFIWSTPLRLTERSRSYLRQLQGLPTGSKRLNFFLDYLGDEDEILSRDAYNEFAVAPYANLVSLKSKMNRQRLVEFIKAPYVSSRHRKLYFTMLGICGTKEDALLLETLMSSGDRNSRASLDALLACYVNLTGEDGLDRIDELFIKNQSAEYADTYSAIKAIRFHDSETNVVPRNRLAESLKLMLKRPALADLVIDDLAKWEDWSVVLQLCELFINASEDSSYVRIPVIKYLSACPFPIAKDKIEELKLVDAEAVHSALAHADSVVNNLGSTELTQPAPLEPVFQVAPNATPEKVPLALPNSSFRPPRGVSDSDHRKAVAESESGAGSRDANTTSSFRFLGGTTIIVAVLFLFVVWRRSSNRAIRI